MDIQGIPPLTKESLQEIVDKLYAERVPEPLTVQIPILYPLSLNDEEFKAFILSAESSEVHVIILCGTSNHDQVKRFIERRKELNV